MLNKYQNQFYNSNIYLNELLNKSAEKAEKILGFSFDFSNLDKHRVELCMKVIFKSFALDYDYIENDIKLITEASSIEMVEILCNLACDSNSLGMDYHT